MKRGIAGSLVFTNFDREALYDILNKPYGVSLEYYRKSFDIPAGGRSVEIEQSQMGDLVVRTPANYPDQMPPFNLNITAANEYGQSMCMGIYGVELLNQGQGLSVDDMVTETQFTFVARAIVGWQPKTDENKGTFGGQKQGLDNKVKQTEAYKAAEKFNSLS
jgi:hypothetical protein